MSQLAAVWALADVAMGLMAIVNLVAICLLGGWAFAALRDFHRQVGDGRIRYSWPKPLICPELCRVTSGRCVSTDLPTAVKTSLSERAHMHVVVTGASAEVATCILAELLSRGHDVRTATDVRDADALVRVITKAHAVVHLDDGAHTVLDTMQRAGMPRLVALSSAASVEEPVSNWGANALLARTTTILGRDSAGPIQRRLAAPVIKGIKNGCNIVQFVHHDDVARFVGDAVEHPHWNGPVNLAASDAIALREVATILGKRYVEIDHRRAAAYLPLLDTTRLDELGFVPAWSSRECVIDFRRANREHIYVGSTRVRLPWRFGWVRAPEPPRQGPSRRPASDKAGEFDTDVHDGWPVYTAVNTSEAFPGPMTPLSLELSLEAMRAMGVEAMSSRRLDGELRRAVIEEQTGSFGHRVYAT